MGKHIFSNLTFRSIAAAVFFAHICIENWYVWLSYSTVIGCKNLVQSPTYHVSFAFLFFNKEGIALEPVPKVRQDKKRGQSL